MDVRRVLGGLAGVAGLVIGGCAGPGDAPPQSILPAPAALASPVPRREQLVPLTLSAAQLNLVQAALKDKVGDHTTIDRVKAGQHPKSGAVTVCGHVLGRGTRMPFTGNFLDVKSKIDPSHRTTTFVPLSVGRTEAERYSVTKVCLEDGLGV